MSVDRSEINDLSKVHPLKVKELERLYEQWAERSEVLPWEYARRIKSSSNK